MLQLAAWALTGVGLAAVVLGSRLFGGKEAGGGRSPSRPGKPNAEVSNEEDAASWRRDVRRQLILVAAGFVAGGAGPAVLEAEVNAIAATVSDPWGPAQPIEFRLGGGIDRDIAATAVTALVALVGALTIALVAGPRVESERTARDRYTLARWGAFVTALSAVAAGLSLGIATTQLVSPTRAGTGAVLLAVSLPSAVLATISVQRKHDQIVAGLATRVVAALRTEVADLRERATLGKDLLPRWRDGLAEWASYLTVGLSVTGYLVLLGLQPGEGDRTMPLLSFDFAKQFSLVWALMTSFFYALAAPWRAALVRWFRKSAAPGASTRSKLSGWIAAGLWTSMLALMGVLIYGAAAVPFLAGAQVLSTLQVMAGMHERGPWGGALRTAIRAATNEYRLALQHAQAVGLDAN